jgi:poly-gamma-glutamate synthesis protein (capsule biosynthesis protein)
MESRFTTFCEKLWRTLASIPRENLEPEKLGNLSKLLSQHPATQQRIANDLVNLLNSGRNSGADKEAFANFATYFSHLDLSDKQMDEVNKKVFVLPINLLGQSLLLHDIRNSAPKLIKALRQSLGEGPVITNLECVVNDGTVQDIRGEDHHSHIVKPEVLDSLREAFGPGTLYALAANHASDGGQAGIECTKREMKKRGMVSAGTGTSAEEAVGGSILTDSATGLKVALVSAASGALDYATRANTIAGVGDGAVLNAIELDGKDEPSKLAPLNQAQVENNINAVKAAAKQADLVVFCYHDHCSENKEESKSEAELPERLKAFAHRIIDAGATVFLGHGPAVLQPKVAYHNGLIDYGAGNAFFQPRGELSKTKAAWESAIHKVNIVVCAGTVIMGERSEIRLELTHGNSRPEMNGIPVVVEGKKSSLSQPILR